MSTYAMSDLHGEADMFHKMLRLIRFSCNDILFILGDVIDRGPDGIELLLKIMKHPNMILLMGNHEYMMMQYFSADATETEIRRWNKNGNAPTRDAFLDLDSSTQAKILQDISELPTHHKLTVGSNSFYLVHGFPGDNVHDEVWGRPNKNSKNPISDSILIIGHTPVLSVQAPEDKRDELKASMIRKGMHPTILHAAGFIDIDCGCSYDPPLKTLGCLRLDDMEEFYVNNLGE